MKKMLSILLATATALSVCGGLAACGGEDNSKTLNVWAPDKSISGYKELVKEFKEDNPEYKDWKIKFIAHEEKTLQRDISKDVANGGDIFFFPSDHLWALADMNAIAPMPDSYYEIVSERDNADVIEFAKNGTTKNPYAYPATNDNGYVFYYDKTKCSASDVLSLTSLQTKAGDTGLQVIYPYEDGFYSCSMFISHTDIKFEYTNASHSGYTTTVDGDRGQAIMTAMVDYFGETKNKKNDKLLIATDNPDTGLIDGFSNGNILGGIGGTWLYKSIADAIGSQRDDGTVEDILGITVLPEFTYTYNGSPVTTHMYSFIGYKYCGVNAQKPRDKQKAAHAFASYLTSYKGQKKRYQATNAGPSNTTLANEVKNDPILSVFEQQRAYGRIQTPQSSAFWDGTDLMDGITTGTITSANMVEKLQEWADQLRENL